MRTFRICEGGKVWRVAMRAIYQDSITNEKRLREVIERSIDKQYGIGQYVKHGLWESCSILGALTDKRVVELHNGKWIEMR